MSARPGIIGIIVGLAGLAGVGTLYTQSRQIDSTQLSRGVELLQTLQRLDSQWSVEVLKVSANPQADFDGLASISPEVRRHARELRDLARKTLQVPTELKSALLSYVSRLDSKEERIERFKSGYAIVRNSQRYLPLAVQLVVAKAAAIQQDELGETIRSQQEVLDNYFANPSVIEKQQIILSLDSLRIERSQYPADLGRALGSFLAHALVLLEQKEPLDELRDAATSLEAGVVAQELIGEISDLIQSRESERARYQQLAIGLALLVLIGLTLFFAFARRATPVAAGRSLPTADSALDISSDALRLYDDLPDTPGQEEPAAPSDPCEQILIEYLLQVVRAGGKQLESHMGLLSAVHVELAKLLVEGQASLNQGAGDTGLATLLGQLNDIFRVKSTPKILQAMHRSVVTVSRASAGFHDAMQGLVETKQGSIDLSQCIENALTHAVPSDSVIRIERKLTPVSALNGSADELTGAMACIISNALESFANAIEPGVLRIQTAADQSTVSVTFTDNGQGMDPKTSTAAFTAFFSTKQDHRGLGLSSALYAVRKHGGQIKLNSVSGKGTAVRLILPIDGMATD